MSAEPTKRGRDPLFTGWRPRTTGHGLFSTVMTLAFLAGTAFGCGKKGPPLPPLVRLPVAPADFQAARRGDTVHVRFTVPSTNTDNTRPANVERVDVYALTGAEGLSAADVMAHGSKVASVAVKAPRDPNQTIEVDEPAEDIEPLEGSGLDQGVVARVEERLGAAALARGRVEVDGSKARALTVEPARPLPSVSMRRLPSRTYVGVGINKSGRSGPISTLVTVPLVPPPPAPETPEVTWTETTVTVTWPAVGPRTVAPASAGVLPSRPIADAAPTLSYNVYEVPQPSGSDGAAASGSDPTARDLPLTETPLAETRFSDPRMTWDTTRCYAVRAVQRFGGLTIESEERAPACVTLKDTFPPAAPKGLTAVASAGAVNLIWDANDEKDLEGYLVLRSAPAGDDLKPMTPAPILETNFRDTVQPGERFAYAVRAVDKAGNASPLSSRIEEAAR